MAVADLRDSFGRPLRDLRISVTDRCNFRCTYCMPKEIFGKDFPFMPKDNIMTFEEIDRLAGIFISLGVKKIRLTGGEPLLRKNIHQLISMLSLRDVEVATIIRYVGRPPRITRDPKWFKYDVYEILVGNSLCQVFRQNIEPIFD